ncbi:hypothetical protein R3P38DRAFT_2772122 [Favolaschia claudopus]|uniref:Uncharacterized protein n=1 Tax=Favolaschia claudopus TaxID=2862362 RepID=A0AAW0C886_9AGAR
MPVKRPGPLRTNSLMSHVAAWGNDGCGKFNLRRFVSMLECRLDSPDCTLGSARICMSAAHREADILACLDLLQQRDLRFSILTGQEARDAVDPWRGNSTGLMTLLVVPIWLLGWPKTDFAVSISGARVLLRRVGLGYFTGTQFIARQLVWSYRTISFKSTRGVTRDTPVPIRQFDRTEILRDRTQNFDGKNFQTRILLFFAHFKQFLLAVTNFGFDRGPGDA